MEDVAKNRRPNFTPAEIELLEEEAKLKDSILFGKFSGPSSALVQQAAWKSIAEKITVVGMRRSVEDL